MNKIEGVEKKFMKKNIPPFSVGDSLKVYVKVVEGDKSRLQAFEGTVIARKGTGTRESFTLRRISYGEGVERTFPLHSPFLEKVEVTRRGETRRAKLYYLRKKIGKKSKLKEKEEEIEEVSVGEESPQEESPLPPSGEAALEAEKPSTS